MKSSPPPQTARVCERCGLEGRARWPPFRGECVHARTSWTNRERVTLKVWGELILWFAPGWTHVSTSPPASSSAWLVLPPVILRSTAGFAFLCCLKAHSWLKVQTLGIIVTANPNFWPLLFKNPLFSTKRLLFYTPQSFIPQIDIWVCDPLSNSAGE